jgi:hypothetical protein
LWKETTDKTVLPYPRGRADLERGSTIQWSVTAVLGDGKQQAVKPSRLTVASKKVQQELAGLAPLVKSKNPDDWLLAAVVYEGAGCHAEALAQYEKAAAQRPRQRNIQDALLYFYRHSFQSEKAEAVERRLEKLDQED